MAKDLNNVNLVGRLVREVEVKYSQSGVAIGRLSIANNDTVKKDNEYLDECSFFDAVVFGNQAENCSKYLKKGSQVAIEGRLKQNTWTDKETQQKRSKVEIIVSTIQFLTKVEGNSNSSQSNSEPNNPYENKNDENIPF